MYGEMAGKLIKQKAIPPPPTCGDSPPYSEMAGKWGQEARYDRRVKYRLLWAVHCTSPPKKNWSWRDRFDRQVQPTKCGQGGGRSGGGGAGLPLPRREEESEGK